MRKGSRIGILLGAIGWLLVVPVTGQTRWVFPSETDGAITEYDFRQLVILEPGAETRGALFLMLPGTDGAPIVYEEITEVAGELGFHAIGLTYNNGEAINELCALTLDSDCHGKVRREVIFGEDTSDLVEVDFTHSILNRLVRLLEYLELQYPEEGWGQYLDPATGEPDWEKVVVAGHSQGAGHAGLLAKTYLVDRVILIAGTDWWGLGQRPSDWILEAGATPPERIFGYGHVDDDRPSPDVLYPTWAEYGLERFGPVTVVEDTEDPNFDYSHQIMTRIEPVFNEVTGKADAHGAMVTDLYLAFDDSGEPVLRPIWEYLLAGGLNPVQQTLTSAVHLGSQVFEKPGWELIRGEAFPWVWPDAMGWWWLEGRDTTDLWIYDPEWGYFWTRDDRFPYLWRASTGTWMYYLVDDAGWPWLYDFRSGVWLLGR